MKSALLAGKKIAVVVPDARIYYTTTTGSFAANDEIETHLDKGRVTRPEYTKIYQSFKKGAEEVFGLKLDLYDHNMFDSSFVLSKNNPPLSYRDIFSIPSNWQPTARKYDIFIVLKIIEQHSCIENRSFKSHSCESKVIASLNNYEWENTAKINVRKIDHDDKSFVQFGTTHSYHDYQIAYETLRTEEITKTQFDYRYAQVKDRHMDAAAESFYEWGKLLSTNIMAEADPGVK